MRRLMVFTNLDGSLLDSVTYSWEPARPALDLLRALAVPIVLVSSRTKMELEQVRRRLELEDPFVIENGGAVYLPERSAATAASVDRTPVRYRAVEFGTPYGALRQALHTISEEAGVEVRGFGDMEVEEIADRTGLSSEEAKLAKQREYDEPFLIEGSTNSAPHVLKAIRGQGLHWTRGGRFFHLTGDNDKGAACGFLLDWYLREGLSGLRRQDVVTVGIGDSLSDAPLLRQVDFPILVRRPDGSYDAAVEAPNLVYAQGSGPVGWGMAVMNVLRAIG
ncbi:MAG: HAD-IIB family hydrolase [Nitrospiraceae bacterium]